MHGLRIVDVIGFNKAISHQVTTISFSDFTIFFNFNNQILSSHKIILIANSEINEPVRSHEKDDLKFFLHAGEEMVRSGKGTL